MKKKRKYQMYFAVADTPLYRVAETKPLDLCDHIVSKWQKMSGAVQ